MEGAFQGHGSSGGVAQPMTAAAIKEQRGKNLAIYSGEVEKLKKEAAELEQRIASLNDEIKQSYTTAWEEMKQRKITLATEKEEFNKLTDENKAINRHLRQSIQEADNREAKADAELRELARQRDKFITRKNQEENRLNERDRQLSAKENKLCGDNQRLEQRNFVIDNRDKESRERERLLEENRDRLKESRRELDSDRQVMELDRRFSKEALATAKRIREEAWKIKEEVEPLKAQAQEKMTEALKKEESNKTTSVSLKQQKIAQDERAKELQDWEDALKADKARLDKRREILKKKG